MAISIDPVFLVTNECIAVTSAMRKNARWAQSGVAAILGAAAPNMADNGNEDEDGDYSLASKLGLRDVRGDEYSNGSDNSLIAKFAKLKSDLTEVEDFNNYSAVAILEPFLDVVKSQATTGVITSIALNAVSRFFTLQVITSDSKDLSEALRNLATAVTHCRFQATDQNEDDAVLLKILALMEEIICKEHGHLIPDSSVCEIVETCLSMACQLRRGDVLRRTAEMTMFKLSQAVFLRMQTLEPEADEPIDEAGEVQMKREMVQDGEIEDIGSRVVVTGNEAEEEEKDETADTSTGPKDEQGGDDDDLLKPHGIASVREVFGVLVAILDPSNQHQYTDSTRIMSLKLINGVFEVSGHDIAQHPSLLSLTTNKLSKHLFQIIRNDQPVLLQTALQVISTLLHTNRKHLKMQQEFFFTYLLTTLSPKVDIPRDPEVDKIFYDGVPNLPKLVKSSSHPVRTQTSTPVGGRSSTPVQGPTNMHFKSPDSREVMVESITSLARIPSFFTDLFVNYDCDVDRTDLCEDLIGFLCRNAYPDTAQWSTPAVPPLCLEAVLALLSSLASNIKGPKREANEATRQKVNQLINKKARKKQAISVAEAFNEKPKAAIEMLVPRGITQDNSPESIAKWLRESGRINKKKLGDYLSDAKNKEVMHRFIDAFDFSHMRIDEALREFLSTFRLPGESALIEKIFEKFASRYYEGEGNAEFVADEDAVFVLAYATIMLNTDQHNAQNKRPMTLDDFKRNLRDANSGKPFAPEFLEEIYRNIKQREIIMPDEHDNDESFEFAWKALLLNRTQAGELTTGDYESFAYDEHVFHLAWRPIVTTLAFVFSTATEDAVFSRVITGFDQMAHLAAFYQEPEVMDHIVECLSRMSTLGAGDQAMPTDNTEVKIELEDNRITVSELSIPFGSDYKAQMSSIILFRIVKKYASQINRSWQHILPALANLYLYSLVAPPYSDELSQQFGVEPLPKVKPANTITRNKGGRDVGLFSFLNYISGADQASEPSDEEIDATLASIDCIRSCNLAELFTTLKNLDKGALNILINWTIASVPEPSDQKQAFYPVALYYLELACALCHKDEDSVDKVWSKLNQYIKNWQSHSSEVTMRIICYGLIISMSNDGHQEVTKEKLGLTLNNILGISPKLIRANAKTISGPVLKLLDSWCKDFVVDNEEYWSLVAHLAVDSGPEVYEAVQKLDPSSITANNFGPIVQCLSTVAAASGKDEHQALQVVESINNMGETVERLDEPSRQGLWYKIIQVLSNQCVHPVRSVRETALKYLQRLLLSPDLQSSFTWQETFDLAMFPLIESLLKPEVFEIDPSGMAVTRVEVASLLCKAFLQFVSTKQVSSASDKENMLQHWTKILDTLDRLVNSGQGELMRESVVESLKNVLRVVATSQDLLDNQTFWDETWKRIDGFLPGLREEVFPPEPEPLPEPEPEPEPEPVASETAADTEAEGAEKTSKEEVDEVD